MPNDQQRQIWNHPDMGKEWPPMEHISDVASPLIFEALNLQPGQRILDVACGGGKTTLLAAQAVGASGQVTGVDISAGMIDLAAGRVRDAGLANVELLCCDAQTDAFPGGPFDAVLSQFGIMFFEDQVAALANIRGQLKPAARAAFIVWQPEDSIPWMPAKIMAQYMPRSEEPSTVERTGSLGDPAFAKQLLEDAGFVNVRAELRNLAAEVSADYVIPESLTVSMVPPEHQQAVRTALAEQRSSFIDGDVARLHYPMVLITGEAPS